MFTIVSALDFGTSVCLLMEPLCVNYKCPFDIYSELSFALLVLIACLVIFGQKIAPNLDCRCSLLTPLLATFLEQRFFFTHALWSFGILWNPFLSPLMTYRKLYCLVPNFANHLHIAVRILAKGKLDLERAYGRKIPLDLFPQCCSVQHVRRCMLDVCWFLFGILSAPLLWVWVPFCLMTFP